MADHRQHEAGMTLIELGLVLVVISILAIATVPQIVQWATNQRAASAARDMANLLSVARAEAIRTRVNHAVFFNTDPQGLPLLDEAGGQVAASVIRDDNGNGRPDVGEVVSTVPMDPSQQLNWGVSLATTRAPGDPMGIDGLPPVAPWTFTQNIAVLANWMLYQPDGTPRGFRILPFGVGAIGEGAGAVYISNGARDYAVVVAPLGGVRVHSWDIAANQWRQ